jgi:hypothetical protein
MMASMKNSAKSASASISRFPTHPSTLHTQTNSSHSVFDAPLEVVLPDELQDSLRRLKPEGNLLKDRMRSMMIRGKVEARKKIPYAKQRKQTLTEKWSYKDWTLEKNA